MGPRRQGTASTDQSLYTTVRCYPSGFDHPDYSCIVVHAGAGYHSTENEQKHLGACRNACQAAMAALKTGGTAIDAVEIAIRILEDDPVTNCGYGSNLNFDGAVEADASIMDSFGRTGAVGATPEIQNPISLARLILERSSQPMSLKRVPPNFVVGEGAVDYARDQQFPVSSPEALVAHSSRVRFSKWQKEIEYQEIMKRKGKWEKVQVINLPHLGATTRPISQAGSALPPTPSELPGTPQLLKQNVDVVTDTVGAICIDRYGNMAAGSSSGGIGMKQPGRVGPAALIGVGTFVKDRGERQVGTVVSGTGEHMLHALISAQAVNRLYDAEDEMEAMKVIINDDFMGAQGYGKANVWGEAAIGVMSLKAENVGTGKRAITFVFGHNTDSFALASMCSNDSVPKTIMSRTSREPKLAIGGFCRFLQMQPKPSNDDLDAVDAPAKASKRERFRRVKKASQIRADKKNSVVSGLEGLHIDGRLNEVPSRENLIHDDENSDPGEDTGTSLELPETPDNQEHDRSDWLIEFDGHERSSSDVDSEPESLSVSG
ncbi:L-asparaginase [Drechslerella dactyloides]|uniref:L-asparaginase n=1 Tax=Drechslerella dactyloides TaxID=74499 RepID=A0AAD6NJ97_DREDA|nr:L-asparaginase [Drechslerella dactyloides]